jgi:DNA-binding response OmpR family regulator
MAPKILLVDDNQELLTLLAKLFERAGYEVLAASRGKQAVEMNRVQKPLLAMLDVLLPDMMGYQVAENIRKDSPGLPVIFVTGVFKGGKHALDAKVRYGAVDYFEKPFEAQKLVAAVQRLVPVEKPKPQVEEDPFEVELDVDVEEDAPSDPIELTGRIRVTGGNLSAELRGEKLTATPLVKSAATVVRSPTSVRPPPAPARGPSASSRGELKDSLPSLITAFYLSKETGELGVQRGKVKKVMYFEKGTPVFASSNLLPDRFGQFLVRTGKIKADQLQDASTAAASTKRRTGDVLIERGLLKDTERMYFVGQQVKAIMYSLFAWEDGTYVMQFTERAAGESIKLDLHPANLITRGIKKLYKPERLHRLLAPEHKLMPSLQPSYALHEVELEKWEGELLSKVDGTKTISELGRIAQKPDQALYGFLFAMKALNILEERK